MARKSLGERQKKRETLVARHCKQRQEFKKIIKSLESTDEEKIEAMRKLEKLPTDSSPVRLRNRCQLTGRPRAYYRKFGMCRLSFRELALSGDIPGITHSSW